MTTPLFAWPDLPGCVPKGGQSGPRHCTPLPRFSAKPHGHPAKLSLKVAKYFRRGVLVHHRESSLIEPIRVRIMSASDERRAKYSRKNWRHVAHGPIGENVAPLKGRSPPSGLCDFFL